MASSDRIELSDKLSYQRCRVKQLCSPLACRCWPMTAEHQNQGPSQEGADERNLSIQGSVDKSTIVVGDRNTGLPISATFKTLAIVQPTAT